MEINELRINDLVEFKKPHPSGTKVWKLIRIGATYKFRSTVINDLFIELRRDKLVKAIKNAVHEEE